MYDIFLDLQDKGKEFKLVIGHQKLFLLRSKDLVKIL